MDKLVMEVKGLNSSFDAADIRGEYYGHQYTLLHRCLVLGVSPKV